MMIRISFILLISIFLGCNSTSKKLQYPDWVGDISFDPNIDNPSFQRCDTYSNQYYNFEGLHYTGEMSAIKSRIYSKYKSSVYKGQTGFLTVRFIVNCKGETGLFRTYSLNNNLGEFTFEKSIETQLLELTKGLSGWVIANYEGTNYDYYQYLTFQIDNGQLISISP